MTIKAGSTEAHARSVKAAATRERNKADKTHGFRWTVYVLIQDDNTWYPISDLKGTKAEALATAKEAVSARNRYGFFPPVRRIAVQPYDKPPRRQTKPKPNRKLRQK